MNVLLLGGTGLISTGITRQLVAEGHEVTCFTRGESEQRVPDDVSFVTGDRNDDEALAAARRSVEPDCVIDMVCYTPEQARAAVDVFDGIEQYIFCSTVDVYHRPPATNPVTEDASREPPVSEYGENKALAENVFLTNDDAFAPTIIRPWSTYGEGGGVLHTFGTDTYYLDRIEKGKPIVVHGDGSSIWGPCHRDDVARAFARAVGTEAAYGEVYHVTSEENITWNQYHRIVARTLEAPEPELVHIPTDVLLVIEPERTRMLRDHFRFSTVFDNAEARRDLEFEYTIPFEAGVRRTITWLDEHDRIGRWDEENDDELIDVWRNATDDVIERLAR